MKKMVCALFTTSLVKVLENMVSPVLSERIAIHTADCAAMLTIALKVWRQYSIALSWSVGELASVKQGQD